MASSKGEETLTILYVITIFFYYFIEQFFLSLPDLYSVVSNILGIVSPESYRVSYPVTLYCYSSVTKAPMLTDILVCFILYYLFFILEETPQAAIVAPEPTITQDSGSFDDWESQSEAGITLPCSSPLPPLGLSRPSTPESIILSTQTIKRVDQNQKVLQNLIDAEEQNCWVTPQGFFHFPFPTIAKGRKWTRRYWRVRNPLPN